MKQIDLHIHTNASDGDFLPKEIVEMAENKNMFAIAITDHDTLAGIKEAQDSALNKKVKIIPGIEITCNAEEFGLDYIHVLGLFIKPDNSILRDLVTRIKKESLNQKHKIIENLNKLGFSISVEKVKEEFGESLSRPHIAKYLIKKYPEQFKEVMQVFHELIGKGKKAYAEQKQATIKETIDAISSAGGISILAHPGIYGNDSKALIDKFISLGGNGIEADYPYEIVQGISKEVSEKMNQKLKQIAKNKNILALGGSDFHGPSVRAVEIGDRGIENEEFKKLLTLINR